MDYLLTAGTLACALLTVFKFFPAIGRARFTEAASSIRDEADDAIISGDLPDVECVRAFVRSADNLAANPGMVSLSRLLAMHFAFSKFDAELAPTRGGGYGELTPGQRKRMHALDKKMIDAIARRISAGSTLAVPLFLVGRVLKRTAAAGKATPPKPTQLAEEFQRNRPDFRSHHSGTPHMV